MAIVEGPFQNIVSINTQSKKYYVAQVNGRVSLYDSNGVVAERQTNFTFLYDRGDLRASFSNYYGTRFAASIQYSNGDYGIVVFTETLQIVNSINTGNEPVYVVGPCSINNDFICMIGTSVVRMSLFTNLSLITLASTVDIVIPESEFSSPVGVDYQSTEVFDPRHVAPMPDGGFCYIKPIELRGENGTFGNGPYVYRGFVVIYFSALGTPQAPIYVKPSSFSMSTARRGYTQIDGLGNIRKKSSVSIDIVLSASKNYLGEFLSIDYILGQYASSLGYSGSNLIGAIGYGNSKYVGVIIVYSGSGPFFPDTYKYAVGDFKTGNIEVVSSENLRSLYFTTKGEFRQFQNPLKSNLFEFFRARSVYSSAYVYVGNVAKDNLSDEETYLQLSGRHNIEDRFSTVSPGPV